MSKYIKGKPKPKVKASCRGRKSGCAADDYILPYCKQAA